MTEEQLKCVLKGIDVTWRVSDALVLLAKENGPDFMKELFDSLDDRQIAECYLLAYEDDGHAPDEDDEGYRQDVSDCASVVSRTRAFILLEMDSEKPSYDARCPICGGVGLVCNDDSCKCFIECRDCGFRIAQRDSREPFSEMAERFAAAEVVPVRFGLISVRCPNCGEEIEIANRHSFFCANCHSRITRRAIEKIEEEHCHV